MDHKLGKVKVGDVFRSVYNGGDSVFHISEIVKIEDNEIWGRCLYCSSPQNSRCQGDDLVEFSAEINQPLGYKTKRVIFETPFPWCYGDA